MTTYTCEYPGCTQPARWYQWPAQGEPEIVECRCDVHKSAETVAVEEGINDDSVSSVASSSVFKV